LFVRWWQSIEILGKQRIWLGCIFWIVAFLYIIISILESRFASGAVFNVLHLIGSYWFAVLLYGIIAVLLIDIYRIISWVADFYPPFIYNNTTAVKAIVCGFVCVMMSAIFIYGYRNAHNPRITNVKIEVNKHVENLDSLRIVMISDLHLGHIHGHKKLARIVDLINAQNPDIIFLAGDILDGNPDPVTQNDLAANFAALHSKYGTYITNGNHEYFGDRSTPGALNNTLEYLKTRGINALNDTTILIDRMFYIAGRKDLSVKRKSMSDLLENVDLKRPVILIDHQPYNLHEAEAAGVDLQLSGHTHRGQMWPANYVTARLFEQDWGLLQKGETHYYVSCGVGTWGPPIRTAGYSEVVVIDMVFR
jgi:predicted MPP superfamily phosphohydrolase